MIRNYFKIALRSIQRQRFYALINIAGLTIGILTSLLIVLYIIDEFSYDRFHNNPHLIYRVNLMGRISEQQFQSFKTPAPLATAMVNEIPGIEKTCRIASQSDVMIRNVEDYFMEQTVVLADSNFFDFFNFRLIEGNKDNVLSKPYNLVLSESAARRIFGYNGRKGSPIGRTLDFGNDKWVCTVSGIVKDPPTNSHFHFSMVVSMQSWDQSRSSAWVNNSLLTYIKLNENTELKQVDSKLSELVEKHVGPQAQAFLGVSFAEFLKSGGAYGFYLQPLSDIHFASDPDLHLEPGGDISTIWLLFGLAIFVIVIASINFMNLSTARYSGRAKEVGIRRSLGGSRMSIRWQFLIESVIYAVLALVIAHFIIVIILPLYNNLAGKVLQLTSLRNINYLASILILVFIVGIIAGSYPAFYLTSFRPAEVLRGTIRAGVKSKSIRRSLVVFQFIMSIGLIICTLLVYEQLKFLEDKDKGFDITNLFVINVQSLGPEKVAFKEELLKMPEVISATICDYAPPVAGGLSDIFMPVDEDDQKRGCNYSFVDEDMLETLKLSMVSGRFFSRDFSSDSRAVVMNEAAAKSFGWKEPLGEKIRTFWKQAVNENEWEVIGIVKDYNYQSLEEEVTSLLLFPGQEGNKIIIRLAGGDIRSQIERIRAKWESFREGGFFDYSIMSDDFFARFSKEQQLGKIFVGFTLLAIIVAAMGLLGLSAFSAEQRSKEMGVRKAMGASPAILIRLLSLEYLNLVLIAFIIAIPLSYLAISWWLKNFAYKTDIGIEPFIMGGILAVVIALLSVGYQSLKTAYRNPVVSLKYE